MSDAARPLTGTAALGDVTSRARGWAIASWRELAPFAIVAGVALALRLPLLAEKPYHHDESEHAWFAWKIVTGQGYEYDPVFHGPVQFYLPSLVYLLAGVGDFTARVAPALIGTAATLLPFFLRRRLGLDAAIVSSVVICLSPSFLYFSRFAREDIYVAVFTFALLAATFRFLDRPRPWHPSLVLGLLAVSFATKETTYITAFVGGTFFAAVTVRELLRARAAGGRLRDEPFVRTLASVGRDAWIWGVATFATVFTLLFTSFFTNPRGLQDGLVESIHYWLLQQPVNRGSQPWFYYLVVLPGYEWPVLLLGVLGAVVVLRRPTLFGCFLVWMFACSLAVYSWASERMPWLILHPLLPLCLLAGIGGAALWGNRGRLVGKLGLLLAAAGAVFAVNAAFQLSYVRPADPRELLVFTQTSTDVPKVRDQLVALARRFERTGRPLTLDVDGWGGTGWPWGWYLRDVPAGYPDMSVPGYKPTSDVLIVAEPNHALVQGQLQDYVLDRRFRLRVWWVPEWGAAGPGDWARWLLFRDTWSPTASLDEFLYVRRGLEPPGSSD